MIYSAKLLDWEYVLKNDNPLKFSILPNQKVEMPKELMKYYKVNENSLDAFTNNYLYASHPFELNDPFDCFNRLISFDKLSLDIYIKFLVDLCGNPRDKVIRLYHEDVVLLKDQFVKLFYEFLFSKLGVISMTTNSLDILMWAHYSNHNGFLLIFDVDLLNHFHGPFPINYVDMAEPIDINENQLLSVLYMTNIKSKCWSYENEWRYLYESKESMKVPTQPDMSELVHRRALYLKESVKEVVLGFDFFQDKSYLYNKEGVLFFDLEKSSDSKYRIRLIDYLIDNGFRVSLIQMFDNLEYKLIKIDIQLIKAEKTIYGYRAKNNYI